MSFTVPREVLIITISAAIGFLLGFKYSRVNPHERGRFALQWIVTAAAVVMTLMAVWLGTWYFSTKLFAEIGSHMPKFIQDDVISGMFLRGDGGFFVYAAIAAGLWWLRYKIR